VTVHKYEGLEWAVIAMVTVSALMLSVAMITHAYGEQMLCHLQPGGNDGWHYRTKIDGRAEACWYLGERMKPRSQLYWAEAPAVVPERPPWEVEHRWPWLDPRGWTHQE